METIDNKEMQNIKSMTQGYVNSSSHALQVVEKDNKQSNSQMRSEFKNEVFIPSEEQIRFLRSVFNPKSGTDLESMLEHGKQTSGMLDRWWLMPGFQEWITHEAEKRMLLYKLEWLAIGLQKMHANVETWKVMGDLFFPKGIEITPPEKGSKRAKLEAEAKKLLETKQKFESIK